MTTTNNQRNADEEQALYLSEIQLTSLEFSAEKIIDSLVDKNGLRYYKVKWFDTWVDENPLLLKCSHLVTSFWESNAEKLNQSGNDNNEAVDKEIQEDSLPQTGDKQVVCEKGEQSLVEDLTEKLEEQEVSYEVIIESEKNEDAHYKVRKDVTLQEEPTEPESNQIRNVIVNPNARDSLVASPSRTTDTVVCGISEEEVIQNDDDSDSSKVNDLFVDVIANVDLESNDGDMEHEDMENDNEKDSVNPIDAIDSNEDKICEASADGNITIQYKLEYESTEGQVVCAACNKVYSSVKALKQHMAIKHYRNGKFQCEVCKKRFITLYDMKRHLKVHTNVKDYDCPHCDMTFKQIGQLTKHVKIHTGDKKFECTICGSCFSEKCKLKEHSYKHAPPENQFECEICEKPFKLKKSLQNHWKNMHCQNTDLDCLDCRIGFPSADALIHHLQHKQCVSMFKCTQCAQYFILKSALEKHKRICHSKKDDNTSDFIESFDDSDCFECQECSIFFASKAYLAVHSKKHSKQTKSACYLCNKRFQWVHNLQHHMTVEHNMELSLNQVLYPQTQNNNLLTDTQQQTLELPTLSSLFTKLPSEPTEPNQEPDPEPDPEPDVIDNLVDSPLLSCLYCKTSTFNSQMSLTIHQKSCQEKLQEDVADAGDVVRDDIAEDVEFNIDSSSSVGVPPALNVQSIASTTTMIDPLEMKKNSEQCIVKEHQNMLPRYASRSQSISQEEITMAEANNKIVLSTLEKIQQNIAMLTSPSPLNRSVSLDSLSNNEQNLPLLNQIDSNCTAMFASLIQDIARRAISETTAKNNKITANKAAASNNKATSYDNLTAANNNKKTNTANRSKTEANNKSNKTASNNNKNTAVTANNNNSVNKALCTNRSPSKNAFDNTSRLKSPAIITEHQAISRSPLKAVKSNTQRGSPTIHRSDSLLKDVYYSEKPFIQDNTSSLLPTSIRFPQMRRKQFHEQPKVENRMFGNQVGHSFEEHLIGLRNQFKRKFPEKILAKSSTTSKDSIEHPYVLKRISKNRGSNPRLNTNNDGNKTAIDTCRLFKSIKSEIVEQSKQIGKLECQQKQVVKRYKLPASLTDSAASTSDLPTSDLPTTETYELTTDTSDLSPTSSSLSTSSSNFEHDISQHKLTHNIAKRPCTLNDFIELKKLQYLSKNKNQGSSFVKESDKSLNPIYLNSNPIRRSFNPVHRSPEPIMQNPVPVMQNPVPIIQNPVQLMQNPEPILQNPEPTVNENKDKYEEKGDHKKYISSSFSKDFLRKKVFTCVTCKSEHSSQIELMRHLLSKHKSELEPLRKKSRDS